jgi:hypothetical protein
MRNLYPDVFSGGGNPNVLPNATAGPTALFGAGAAEAFAASFSTATTAAMETLGNKLKEARAEERQDKKDEKTSKSKWSELAQSRILRCHGHEVHVLWDPQNVSEIWGQYQEAMREGTSPVIGIVETFASYFHRDPSVLEGERPHLSISTVTAKCIKEGRICPQPGVLMYENIDEGLMPLAFVRRESHEVLEDTYQQEEYERSNHHTLEGERVRSSRCRTRKAPDTYSDTVALLRGYAEVIKGHFSETSAGFKAIDRVFRCLVSRQDTWKNAWNSEVGARFWWLFSKSVHAWMSPSEWGHGGIAPSMDVDPVVACLAGGNFGPQVDLPVRLMKFGSVPLIDSPTSKRPLEPAPLAPAQGYGFQGYTNPNVHPKIQSGIWLALDKFGGRTTLRSLMNYGPAAGSTEKFLGTIISDAHCQEFVVAGKCSDRRCNRKHDASYTPREDQIETFLSKVKPIAAYVLAHDIASLERVKKRMRVQA